MKLLMGGIIIATGLFINSFSWLLGMALWLWPIQYNLSPQPVDAQTLQIDNSCLQACHEPQAQTPIGVQ